MITNLPSPLYKIEPSFIVAALTQNYNRQTARPGQEFVHTRGREILRDTTFAENGIGAPVCAKERQVQVGVGGIGVHFEVTPNLYAAISVGAIRSRMPQDRKLWIADMIQEELCATGFRSPVPVKVV